MNTRTWNIKLVATEEHPETTLENVPQEQAAKILRRMMYGPARSYAVALGGRRDGSHENPLAA